MPRAALATLRGGGPLALVRAVLRRSLRGVATFHTLLFFEKPLDEPSAPVTAGMPIEVQVIASDELARFRPDLEAIGVRWEEVPERAARGHRCTVARSGGRVVHVRWMATGKAWVDELRGWLVPQPGEVYVYGSYTPPDVRGRDVQPAVSTVMTAWSRGQGYLRHIFYVRADNAPGLKIVGKIGARRTGRVRCWWIRGLGAWISGLDEWTGPRLDFGPNTSVRRLGEKGRWVRRTR
jgi:hypothetical protein